MFRRNGPWPRFMQGKGLGPREREAQETPSRARHPPPGRADRPTGGGEAGQGPAPERPGPPRAARPQSADERRRGGTGKRGGCGPIPRLRLRADDGKGRLQDRQAPLGRNGSAVSGPVRGPGGVAAAQRARNGAGRLRRGPAGGLEGQAPDRRDDPARSGPIRGPGGAGAAESAGGRARALAGGACLPPPPRLNPLPNVHRTDTGPPCA